LKNKAFFFQGTSLLLKEGVDPAGDWELPFEYTDLFPSFETFAVPAINGTPDAADRNISCIYVPGGVPLPPGWRTIPVRRTLSLLPNDSRRGSKTSRMLRAFHIAQWRLESRFCGSCGSENGDAPGETARLCPVCGRMEFPRITPAVLVRVTNDEGKILLARNKNFTSGVYSLIAGYNEAGENLEATVARETREEVNIDLCQIRYLTSEPWPFPHSLMAGFTARYAGGFLKPDGVEIEDARWFDRDNLPQLPGPGSLSRLLIEDWLDSGCQDR